ncbi:MAG: hypothetical protein ACHQFW_05980 [Chitinophagales bacterium]
MNLTYIIILRLFHIYTGVFWAGATFYLARFVLPASNAIPEGGKFMQQLAKTNKLPIVMMVMSILNIVSGILLIYEFSNGFDTSWFSTNFGMTLSIGGTFAIIAFVLGFTITRPVIMKMATLGKEIAAAGGAPTPDQISLMITFRNKVSKATNLIALLLIVTVVTMAIGRYL